jgi:hypothetical protein
LLKVTHIILSKVKVVAKTVKVINFNTFFLYEGIISTINVPAIKRNKVKERILVLNM